MTIPYGITTGIRPTPLDPPPATAGVTVKTPPPEITIHTGAIGKNQRIETRKIATWKIWGREWTRWEAGAPRRPSRWAVCPVRRATQNPRQNATKWRISRWFSVKVKELFSAFGWSGKLRDIQHVPAPVSKRRSCASSPGEKEKSFFSSYLRQNFGLFVAFFISVSRCTRENWFLVCSSHRNDSGESFVGGRSRSETGHFFWLRFSLLAPPKCFLSEFLLFLYWNENWSASIFLISCLKPFFICCLCYFFLPPPSSVSFLSILDELVLCARWCVYVVHKMSGFCFLHTLCLAVLKSFRLHRFVQSSWDVFCGVIGISDLICVFFSYSLHRSLSSDLFIRMRVRPPTPPTPLVNAVILTHSFSVNF